MGGTFRGMTLKKMAAGDQDLDEKKDALSFMLIYLYYMTHIFGVE